MDDFGGDDGAEGIPTFRFQESSHFNKFKITVQRLNITDLDQTCDKFNDCIVLYNVFTKDECQQLIDQGDSYGFHSLDSEYSAKYRNNKRIFILNPSFSEVMWKRVNEYIEDTLDVTIDHPTLHTTKHIVGQWQKFGLNERLRLCKYDPTNFFKPHFDDGYNPEPNKTRTMKTCMVYLNEEFEGGETIFYANGKKFALKPKTGMCLIFNQKIFHEGATVTKGLKYFVRTDVYYQRLDEHPMSLDDKEKKALELYTEANRLWTIGDQSQNVLDQAMKCLKNATRLCPDIEELYYSMQN